MSDPKYGEPVEEPKPVDDVVGSARAGLADAEASRDAVTTDDWDAAYSGSGSLPAREERAARDERAAQFDDDVAADRARTDAADRDAVRPASEDRAYDSDFSGSPAARPTTPVADDARPDDARHDDTRHDDTRSETATRAYGETGTRTSGADDDTRAYTGAVSPSEPAAGQASPAQASAPQPIFVQAPEAPNPRGNRGAAGAIGLLAALVFAVIYLGAALGIGALNGDVTLENIGTEALAAVTSWWLWVPVAVFFLSFWILGAVINRGRWGLWVIFGLLVGIASYAGHILGQLFQEPFWTIAPSEALRLVGEQAFVPLALVALVAGRELTIWFGAWVAARGKRVTELNVEAQREYERTLEAGPQLHRY